MVQSDESRHISNPHPLACLLPPDLGEQLTADGEWLDAWADPHATDPDPLEVDLGGVSFRLDGGWDVLRPNGHYAWLMLRLWANQGQRRWPCSIGSSEHDVTSHRFMVAGASHSTCPPRIMKLGVLDGDDEAANRRRFEHILALRDTALDRLSAGVDPKVLNLRQPQPYSTIMGVVALFAPYQLEGFEVSFEVTDEKERDGAVRIRAPSPVNTPRPSRITARPRGHNQPVHLVEVTREASGRVDDHPFPLGAKVTWNRAGLAASRRRRAKRPGLDPAVSPFTVIDVGWTVEGGRPRVMLQDAANRRIGYEAWYPTSHLQLTA